MLKIFSGSIKLTQAQRKAMFQFKAIQQYLNLQDNQYIAE